MLLLLLLLNSLNTMKLVETRHHRQQEKSEVPVAHDYHRQGGISEQYQVSANPQVMNVELSAFICLQINQCASCNVRLSYLSTTHQEGLKR